MSTTGRRLALPLATLLLVLATALPLGNRAGAGPLAEERADRQVEQWNPCRGKSC